MSKNLGDFVRLWLMLGFAYLLVRVAVDVALVGAVDLRRVALLELVLVPLAQTIFLRAVGRKARHDAGG